MASRIKAIDAPADNNSGLHQLKMSRLGKVVLIAGQNGSGKTRLLNRVEQLLANKLDSSSKQALLTNINAWNSNISSWSTECGRLNSIVGSIDKNPSVRVAELERSIRETQHYLQEGERQLQQHNSLEMEVFDQRPIIIRFVPKRLDLSDDHNMNKGELIRSVELDVRYQIGELPHRAVAYIQQWHTRHFNATHQNSSIGDDERRQIIARYNDLNDSILSFLGERLESDIDNNARIFGLRLGQAGFSDGQKILIQFCVALHAANANIKDVILFLDEPENHLHPAILVSVLRKIADEIVDGQIWIATHSIHVLSMFDADSIWFMKSGCVFPGGRFQKDVLHGLLGEVSDIERLRDFIDLPEVISRNEYAYQCLKAPSSVVTGSRDPQTTQAHEDLISAARGIARPLRVLDFGAGKGRMIKAFGATDREDGTKTQDWLDYVAVELSESDRRLATEEISQVYGASSNRVFSNLSDVVGAYGHGHFDVVIMCNVLHEIDPIEWCNLFSPTSQIFSLLKNEGRLLMIEDQVIPVGEMAYKNGFIVLDTPSIRVLFSADSSEYSSNDFRGDGRLKAHSVAKSCVAKVSAKSRTNALNEHLSLSKAKILEMREQRHSPIYSDGRRHAFWVQQFANTKLALEQLGVH